MFDRRKSSFSFSKQYSKEEENSQDEVIYLSDRSETGRDRPWDEKKVNNLIVAETSKFIALEETGLIRKHYLKMSESLYNCGQYLEFITDPKTGKKKLIRANFCRKRLCPMCSWRRSLKIYGHVNAVMNYLQTTDPTARYLFATFTVKNVPGSELEETIKKMISAFPEMWRAGKLKKSFLGAYRGVEITYNKDENTYHPHIHAILMVKASYFNNSENYLSQKDYVELWQKKMKLDYVPVVDVRAIKKNTAKAVAEVAKYSVKDSDIIDPEDVAAGADIVKTLDVALHRKRLIAFYGKMKEAHHKLNLDDEEDGDLILTTGSEEEKLLSEGWIKETYAFNSGCFRYQKTRR